MLEYVLVFKESTGKVQINIYLYTKYALKNIELIQLFTASHIQNVIAMMILPSTKFSKLQKKKAMKNIY